MSFLNAFPCHWTPEVASLLHNTWRKGKGSLFCPTCNVNTSVCSFSKQLLQFLQEFSQQTISRTHEIKKQVDGLIQETKATHCRLHNVFNDFLMLSNTQFIENVSSLSTSYVTNNPLWRVRANVICDDN